MDFYEKGMKRLWTTNVFISRHFISSGFSFSVITVFSNLLEISQTSFDATDKYWLCWSWWQFLHQLDNRQHFTIGPNKEKSCAYLMFNSWQLWGTIWSSILPLSLNLIFQCIACCDSNTLIYRDSGVLN